jgi:hypothetical protein
VSYLICDLLLGSVYYRDFVDPLSGWAHHLFYLGVMARATGEGNISTFFAMGTPIEGKYTWQYQGSVCCYKSCMSNIEMKQKKYGRACSARCRNGQPTKHQYIPQARMDTIENEKKTPSCTLNKRDH